MDVRCIIMLNIAIVGQELVQHQPVDVRDTNRVVVIGLSACNCIVMLETYAAKVIMGLVDATIPIGQAIITSGLVIKTLGALVVGVKIIIHVNTPIVDMRLVEQPLMVVKYTRLVMAQVLAQAQLIPSVHHRVL